MAAQNLPIFRDMTYVPNLSEVRSAGLNALQDEVCGVFQHFFDDFFCFDTELWQQTADGAGFTGAGSSNVVELFADAVNGHRTKVATGPTLGVLAQLPAMRARVRIPIVTTLRTYIGLVDNGSSLINLGFVLETAVTAHLQLCVGPAQLQFDTGFTPAAGTFYVLTAQFTDSTHVFWAIAASENAIPLASGTVTVAAAVATSDLRAEISVQTLAAQFRTLDVDYISIAPTGARGNFGFSPPGPDTGGHKTYQWQAVQVGYTGTSANLLSPIGVRTRPGEVTELAIYPGVGSANPNQDITVTISTVSGTLLTATITQAQFAAGTPIFVNRKYSGDRSGNIANSAYPAGFFLAINLSSANQTVGGVNVAVMIGVTEYAMG